MYSRDEIEEARQRSSGVQRPLELRDVPLDAPYEGEGPLYDWDGEKWVTWEAWRLLGRTDEATPEAAPKPKPRTTATQRKSAGKAALTAVPSSGDLFDETA